VECHDNYTFYDFGFYALKESDSKVKDAARIALSLILLSIGVPFIHAGQEFFRTKRGVENAYNASDYINAIDYKRRDENIDIVNMVSDLIEIRKKYDCFRIAKKSEVLERVHTLEGATTLHTAGIMCENKDCQLYIFAKNDKSEYKVDVVSSEMIFDGFRKCSIKGDSYTLKEPGIYVIRKDSNVICR
jgi:pullulanase